MAESPCPLVTGLPSAANRLGSSSALLGWISQAANGRGTAKQQQQQRVTRKQVVEDTHGHEGAVGKDAHKVLVESRGEPLQGAHS